MVNKVILLGNVGKDPEVKYFDNDVAVANFTLATSERAFKTRDGQEVPERTEWHNIVAWRGLARIAENYIKKGSQLYVEGKLRTRSYDDANGVKRYTTEIVADSINLLGRRPSVDSGTPYPQTEASQANATKGHPQSPSTNDPPISDESGVEDDLPF